MINQDRFRERLRDAREYTKLTIVIHAIWVAASRFLPSSEQANPALSPRWTLNSVRRWVVANAMEHMSLEGMQALIMIAFDDVSQPLITIAEHSSLTIHRSEAAKRPEHGQSLHLLVELSNIVSSLGNRGVAHLVPSAGHTHI